MTVRFFSGAPIIGLLWNAPETLDWRVTSSKAIRVLINRRTSALGSGLLDLQTGRFGGAWKAAEDRCGQQCQLDESFDPLIQDAFRVVSA